MVLVDHQVAGGEVGIGLELLAVGGLLFLPGPLLGGCLALGDDGQLQVGVLHAAGQAAHGEHDLSRFGQGLGGELHPGGHLLLPQEGLEIQRPLLRGHQHQHPEPGGLVVA